MSKKVKTVGLLGGIGPEATGYYYLKLIDYIKDNFFISNNTDFPHIFVNSIPGKELTSKVIYPSDLHDYIVGIKELDTCGVTDGIVVLCNTANLYIDALSEATKNKIYNSKEIVLEYLITNDIINVSVLGTHSTVRSGLYAYKGINNIELDSNDLRKLEKTILKYNTTSKGKYINDGFVDKLIDKQMKKGADLVILGCTEIVMMSTKNTRTLDPILLTIERLGEIIYKNNKGIK